MRKTLFKRFSIMLICIFLLNSTFLYAYSARTAVIEKTEGSVQIKKGGGEKKFNAFKGMSLSEGDTLITGSNGAATLKLDDDKTIKIAANTVINIKDLKGKKGNETTTISQPKGSTVTSLGDKLLGNSSYNQKTPTAIMGIKGTVVGITQNPGNTLFSVADGIVRVGDTRGTQLALVNPGQLFTVVPGVPPAPPTPLALQELNPFTVKSFNEFGSHLSPAIAAQVSDYLKSRPEAPAAPASQSLQPPKIDLGLPAPSGGSGGSGTSGNPGGPGGETIPPAEDDSVNLPGPLLFNSVSISEYVSQPYQSTEKLAAFLTEHGIAASSESPNTLTYDLPYGAEEIHLSKNYTIAPNTSIMLPNELLNLHPGIMLQLNEFLGKTASGNNHWSQLITPIPTKVNPNEWGDVIRAISSSSQSYGNNSFEMTPMIYIHSSQPCEIQKSHINSPYPTTPSVYTIDANSDKKIRLSDFSSSIITMSVNGQILPPLSFNPSNPNGAAVANAFNSVNAIINPNNPTNSIVKATYGLDITNKSSHAKKLGIDLRLCSENGLIMPSYLNSGFTATIEDIKTIDDYDISVTISNITELLSSGKFRALAPLKANSINLDSNNLLNWKYENTSTSPSVNNKIIYSNDSGNPIDP